MKRSLYILPLAATALLVLSACSSSDDTVPLVDDSAPGAGIAEGEPNPSAPGEDTSTPTGDEPLEPLSDVPGGDTRAIAGYWDGSAYDDFPDASGTRYFVITENGLVTEYFLIETADEGGNCYGFQGPQTLTPEDSAANAYSLSDGRTMTATTDAERTALTVDIGEDDAGAMSWPAVIGLDPGDLPICAVF